MGDDREAVCDWIDANQLGRRNLTPDQRSILQVRRAVRVAVKELFGEGFRRGREK